MPATRLPAIPGLPANLDPSMRRLLQPIKERLEIMEGRRGINKDRVVTLADLIDSGVLKTGANGSLTIGDGVADMVTSMTSTPDTSGGYSVPTTPPNPGGLMASGALQNIILFWSNPNYPGHAYTEIWRSATNNRANAVLIGTTPAFVWADPVGESSKLLYYWIRFVSTFDTYSGFYPSGTAGIPAQTGQIDTPDIAFGTITAESGILASLAVVEANIADGAVTNLKIGNEIYSDAYIGSGGALGWRIAKDGTVIFNDGYFRGDIEASSIKVDAANIVSTLHLQGQAVTFAMFAYTKQVTLFGETNAIPSNDNDIIDWVSADFSGAITAIAQSNPILVTAPGHGLKNSYYVKILDVQGMTEVNGNTYEVSVVNDDQFRLMDPITGNNVNGTGFTAYTGGGAFYVNNDYVMTELQVLNLPAPDLVGVAPYLVGFGGRFRGTVDQGSMNVVLKISRITNGVVTTVWADHFDEVVVGATGRGGFTNGKMDRDFYYSKDDDPPAGIPITYRLLGAYDLNNANSGQTQIEHAIIRAETFKR